MLTDEQLARMTPEEMLVVVMQKSANLTEIAGDCHRFGWDLKFGSGTNNQLMVKAKQELDQITKAYFLRTRRGE